MRFLPKFITDRFVKKNRVGVTTDNNDGDFLGVATSEEPSAELRTKAEVGDGTKIELTDYIYNWRGTQIQLGNNVMDLIKRGANPNQENQSGETPIFAAVKKGHLNLIPILSNRGANLNHTTQSEETPMLEAIYRCDLKMMTKLQENGAKFPPLFNQDSGEPLLTEITWKIWEKNQSKHREDPTVITKNQLKELFEELIRQNSAIVDMSDRSHNRFAASFVGGRTETGQHGSLQDFVSEATKVVIANSHSIQHKNKAAERAASWCLPDILECALKHGVKPNKEVADHEGSTLLEEVISRSGQEKERLKAVEILMNAGAKIAPSGSHKSGALEATSNGLLLNKIISMVIERRTQDPENWESLQKQLTKVLDHSYLNHNNTKKLLKLLPERRDEILDKNSRNGDFHPQEASQLAPHTHSLIK